MPSLKVAWVAAMNAASSMPSSRLKLMSGGMVDSPTPTVPIASDSTSVTSTARPMVRAIAAAAIHPAVPPPATTMRRMRLPPIIG